MEASRSSQHQLVLTERIWPNSIANCRARPTENRRHNQAACASGLQKTDNPMTCQEESHIHQWRKGEGTRVFTPPPLTEKIYTRSNGLFRKRSYTRSNGVF